MCTPMEEKGDLKRFLKNLYVECIPMCNPFFSVQDLNQQFPSWLDEQNCGTEHSVVYSDQHAFLLKLRNFAFKISSIYHSLVDSQEI